MLYKSHLAHKYLSVLILFVLLAPPFQSFLLLYAFLRIEITMLIGLRMFGVGKSCPLRCCWRFLDDCELVLILQREG